MAEGSASYRVCVTGGSGYVASSLIKKLLLHGHTVHATLRNLNDESKVGVLKSLPNAGTHLVLFEADIYKPHQFEAAIRGCQFVFHVATPLRHTPGSQYKNRTEASVAAGRKIGEACRESGTVRRLVYTGSVVSMSPMKEDGSGFKEVVDECCWTPLHLSYPFSNPTFQVYGGATPSKHSIEPILNKCVLGMNRREDLEEKFFSLLDWVGELTQTLTTHNSIKLEEYTDSKTKTEKELLEFGESSGDLEVVSLACGLISGETVLPHVSETTAVTVSQFTDLTPAFHGLRYLEELDGKVPLVHIDDICDAHIFCMEQSSMRGRFCCASSYLSSSDIANYYRLHHPELDQKQGECDDVPIRNVELNSQKLVDRGFKYKYDGNMILEAALQCYKSKDMFDVTAILPPNSA